MNRSVLGMLTAAVDGDRAAQNALLDCIKEEVGEEKADKLKRLLELPDMVKDELASHVEELSLLNQAEPNEVEDLEARAHEQGAIDALTTVLEEFDRAGVRRAN